MDEPIPAEPVTGTLDNPSGDPIPGTPLLFARVLDGEGAGRELSWEEAKSWKPSRTPEVLWVHLAREEPQVDPWLVELGIPEPTRELMVSDKTRPRAFREGNTLVATLRGINFNPGAEPEDMLSMQMWCDGKRLVTLRRNPLQTPRQVLKMIDRREAGPTDAGALITELTEAMINRMNRSIVDMNQHLDRLEHMEDDGNAEQMLDEIAIIRRNCLGLKRHMGPMHEALESISRYAPPWFEDHDRREIAESIDRLRRYLEDLDISKESAVVMMDDIRASSIARSEQATYLLTIVAGIFLPLGFITGLLGINVGGVPGMDDGNAFWVVVGLCGAILIVQLLLFWKWKWL
ncbi:CorA family divalent cation transporter [Aurantiacibacter sediminis]|uniref:Zinc transporter ZntB n=1 Tax=Aurantiacibacter sediminis TaxID=2793064 RepID=A0ABS0N123_9SPHN|nr:CorA family divalent cation transporter [Aurantiacibacter sediminis]MBH5320995.1 zinc transporter ZntB [Aurantiacibacter sediminis]